jgi:hypothetical protein
MIESPSNDLRPGLALTSVLLVCLAALAGCTEGKRSKIALDSGLPVMRSGMTVAEVQARGPYIEAVMLIDEEPLPVYAAPTDACHTVFETGEKVVYIDSGPLGRFERADASCQIMGVGNLELWRDRNRRATPGGVPRAQANYRTIAEDEDFVLLRGRFPLASALGFSGGMDIVSVVPNDQTCSTPIEAGIASMEYRGKGRRALSLVGSRGLCRIHGLILPLSDAKPRKKENEQADEKAGEQAEQ